MGKHHSNPQYFKGEKLQNEIFNQLNIKKVKLTKIILGNAKFLTSSILKKVKLTKIIKKTKKKRKKMKKCKKNKKNKIMTGKNEK